MVGIDTLVICPLGTVYQRPALYGHHSAVGGHLVIGTDGARLHLEVQLYAVALLPLTTDGQVAVFR